MAIKLLLIFITLNVFGQAHAQETELSTCRDLSGLGYEDLGNISCEDSYHHYNSGSVQKYYSFEGASKNSDIRIGSFNMFQAGSLRTEFKDYEIVAKIINNFDMTAAVELSPLMGEYKKHNASLVDLLTKVKKENPEDISEQVDFIKKQYELPGYIKTLLALRKLDPSWALIITPFGEGAENATIKELSGFFYRASVIRPVENEYCKQFFPAAESFACYPNFSTDFYGKEVSKLISRRPFMASFKSANFDFTSLAVHTIFTPPRDSDLKLEILQAAFDHSNLESLPEGLNKTTYPRFAEIKHIYEFTKKLKNVYNEKDIIISGDFNLSSDEVYWKKLLTENDDKLLVTDETSLALSRTRSGDETEGTRSNYDHFILNTKTTRGCDVNSAKAFNFIENDISSLINERYLIRSEITYKNEETGLLMYHKLESAEDKKDHIIKTISADWADKFTLKKGEFVPRFDIEQKTKGLVSKLLNPQLFDRSYFRYYQEIVSDHLPVYMSCSNSIDLD